MSEFFEFAWQICYSLYSGDIRGNLGKGIENISGLSLQPSYKSEMSSKPEIKRSLKKSKEKPQHWKHGYI